MKKDDLAYKEVRWVSSAIILGLITDCFGLSELSGVVNGISQNIMCDVNNGKK